MEPAALSPGLFANAERKISLLVVDDLMNGQPAVPLYLSGSARQPGGDPCSSLNTSLGNCRRKLH